MDKKKRKNKKWYQKRKLDHKNQASPGERKEARKMGRLQIYLVFAMIIITTIFLVIQAS